MKTVPEEGPTMTRRDDPKFVRDDASLTNVARWLAGTDEVLASVESVDQLRHSSGRDGETSQFRRSDTDERSEDRLSTGLDDMASTVERVVDGDADATEAFIARSRDWLSRKAQRYSRFLDVEALVQETLLYLLKDNAAALKRFHDMSESAPVYEDALKHFVYDQLGGIASNCRRSAKREFRVHIDPQDRGLEAESSTELERQVIARDLLERFFDCLEGSDPMLSLIYRLKAEEGKSAAEIAAILGLSIGKVYALESRLRVRALHCREREIAR